MTFEKYIIKDDQEYRVNGKQSLSSIIKIITDKIEKNQCPIVKSECMLDIVYLLISHLKHSYGNIDNSEDGEIVFEKLSRK